MPRWRAALHRSLGRQSEHRGRAILGLSRSGTEYFASADTIVRTEFEPGTKVLFVCATAHVTARFGDDDFHGQGTQARQTGQIHRANAAQMSLALQLPANLGRAGFQSAALLEDLLEIEFAIESLKLLFNLVFTSGDLKLIGILEFARRLQGEKMLASVISF